MSYKSVRSKTARSRHIRRGALISCGAIVLAVVCGWAIWNTHTIGGLRPLAKGLSAGSKDFSLPISAGLPTQRRLYAFSVIPGGVQSAQELLAAARNDSLVRAHYADFNIDDARPMKLDRDRAVYVSYRMDGKIFWTSHKVALRKGETLITDGSHLARTRCGNRVSDTPQSPVSAAQPALDALDHFAPVGELYTTNLPINGSLVPPPGFSLPTPAADPVGYPLPFFPFIPGPGGPGNAGSSITNSPSGPVSSTPSGSSTGTSSPSGPGSPLAPGGPTGPGSPGGPSLPPGPDSPPVTTPEPGTLLLVGLGLTAVGFVRKVRNCP